MISQIFTVCMDELFYEAYFHKSIGLEKMKYAKEIECNTVCSTLTLKIL